MPATASLPAAVNATDLEKEAINTLRFLAVDAVQHADSGHPGMPMGAAPMAYVLWQRHLRHAPHRADWPGRDRFVLSAGHGSMLLYGLLHLTGYDDVPMEQLKRFRQTGSRTAGHPENFLLKGVEVTTGPLGQGFANGVGLAMAESHMAARFNRNGFPLFDGRVYGIVSDGDLMEGISHEAASLAGHLGLGRLVYLYDDNEISIDGSTDLAFTEDVGARFEAYGWHVVHVDEGEDLDALDEAIQLGKAETERPTLVVVRTHIGYGSPNKQDTSSSHGSPLGDEEVARTKEALGWPKDKTFYVPDAVREHFAEAQERGQEQAKAWDELMEGYREAHPDLAQELELMLSGELPEGWTDALPDLTNAGKQATRKSSEAVLKALLPAVPELIGGSADLTPSNNTRIEGLQDVQTGSFAGRYVRWGVREMGMAAACNGIALHGTGLRPYCGTFLIFSDYMRAAMRLSALSRAGVVYVLTHDSIGLGEDGPTHQPVEQLMSLRAIPRLHVIRPADAAETAYAWRAALEYAEGPTVLALTRQGLPPLERTAGTGPEGVLRGAYVVSDGGDGEPDIILMGTGSEVQLCVEAAAKLKGEGVAARVVSMPCWELFAQQDEAYQEEVLPRNVRRRVAVEAGVSLGWEKFVGFDGRVVGLDRFGSSGPGDEVMAKLGFTTEHVLEQARAVLDA